MKNCSRCQIAKSLSDFHKRSDRITGVQSHCRECQKVRGKTYRTTERGREKARENHFRYYHNNKELALTANKRWREENKESRQVYLLNYEHTRRVRNPEKVAMYVRKSRNKKYKVDPKFRLQCIVSTGIRKSLYGKKNGFHWESLVDFTYDELVVRLKKTIPNGYRWSDYETGKTDLEIDHIIPVSAFNFSDSSDIDFKRCWSLHNLRLLPKVENRSKKDSLVKPFQPCLGISMAM